MNTEPPLYVPHDGTVRVAGNTVPRRAAWCAFSYLEAKKQNVEFVFIGASSGQQALKAIGILSDLFESRYKNDFVLVFRPMRFSTVIDQTGNATSEPRKVDAQAWRCYVIDLNKLVHEDPTGSR